MRIAFADPSGDPLPGGPVQRSTNEKRNMTTTKKSAVLEGFYRENPRAACREALALTRSLPWKDRLEAIDKLLGTFGTEAIRGDWQNGYWGDIVAIYCNTGDTYATTVIHVRGGCWNPQGRFLVGNWGDWVARNSVKYGIR